MVCHTKPYLPFLAEQCLRPACFKEMEKEMAPAYQNHPYQMSKSRLQVSFFKKWEMRFYDQLDFNLTKNRLTVNFPQSQHTVLI